MTEPFLLQFIDKVYKNCLNYCVICLRTSEERRLEQPIHLKKFIQNVSNLDQQCFKFNRSHQLVCFVCERQAAAASQFLTALGLATHAHTAIQQLIDMPVLRFQFHASYLQHLLTNPQPDLNNMGVAGSMLNLESKLRKHRVQTQLLHTEVLVVSTPSAASDCLPETLPAEIPTTDCEEISKPGESSDLYVIPDLISTTGTDENIDPLSQTSDKEIKVESILILDDDDDPISINSGPRVNAVPSRLGTIDPLKGKAACGIEMVPQRVTVASPCSSEWIAPTSKAMPRLERKIPRIEIPKVSAKPIEVIENTRKTNHDLKEAKAVPIVKQTEVPTVSSSTSFILHPIVFNSGMVTVPSLTANIMEGQLVTSGCNTLTFETPDLAFQNDGNIEFITNPDKVTTILKNLSHHDISKVYIFKSVEAEAVCDSSTDKVTGDKVDSEATSICTISEPRSLDTDGGKLPRNGDIRLGESGAKRPDTVKPKTRTSSDQINWEDKIPMDVISFVNEHESTCKRPRSSEQPPPLGICNVTSLSYEDVIDLC